MTRDEAAKIVRDKSLMDGPPGDNDLRKKWSETMVDTLAELGILKLDEPKNASARLCEALGWTAGARSEHELISALHKAKLKLVEQ